MTDLKCSSTKGARITAAIFMLGCILASTAGQLLRPTREVAILSVSQRLEDVVPKHFGHWKIDESITPVIPDPRTLAAVNRIYTDALARTYVNAQGQHIMLSMAYGRRQDETMRLHQPEGCYAGQGFSVRRIGEDQLQTTTSSVSVMRLDTALGERHEPVSYWMVVGGRHAISQFQGKLAQLSFGFKGYIPDGLLVRVSSISADPQAAFEVQDDFVRDLLSALPAQVRDGMTGT